MPPNPADARVIAVGRNADQPTLWWIMISSCPIYYTYIHVLDIQAWRLAAAYDMTSTRRSHNGELDRINYNPPQSQLCSAPPTAILLESFDALVACAFSRCAPSAKTPPDICLVAGARARRGQAMQLIKTDCQNGDNHVAGRKGPDARLGLAGAPQFHKAVLPPITASTYIALQCATLAYGAQSPDAERDQHHMNSSGGNCMQPFVDTVAAAHHCRAQEDDYAVSRMHFDAAEVGAGVVHAYGSHSRSRQQNGHEGHEGEAVHAVTVIFSCCAMIMHVLIHEFVRLSQFSVDCCRPGLLPGDGRLLQTILVFAGRKGLCTHTGKLVSKAARDSLVHGQR